jgi:molybdopterin-guanine dinucleotide biosynthesis protein A
MSSLQAKEIPPASDILGVLLAGGLARRMGGGDKCLISLAGQTLLRHVITRARPQVSGLLLNAAGNPDRFAPYRLPVAADVIPDFAGPLAGVLTGMEWAAKNRPQVKWVTTFATDTPFFPQNLVERMWAAINAESATLACASSGGRTHPVFGLWPVALRHDLRQALVQDGIHKVDRWTARFKLAQVDFPAQPFDPFFNINTPEDIATAEDHLNKMASLNNRAGLV